MQLPIMFMPCSSNQKYAQPPEKLQFKVVLPLPLLGEKDALTLHPGGERMLTVTDLVSVPLGPVQVTE